MFNPYVISRWELSTILHVHVSKSSSHNVPVMSSTFGCFCFNIHEIVQIRSLNRMIIRNINAVPPPIPGSMMRMDENTPCYTPPAIRAQSFQITSIPEIMKSDWCQKNNSMVEMSSPVNREDMFPFHPPNTVTTFIF